MSAAPTGPDFDLDHFLPYLLNQAAEATSRGFQAVYKAEYGLTRTQWRVLAHLGRFTAMTARDICDRAHEDKTKVSRAVAVLEAKGWLHRAPSPDDGRAELLSLTVAGRDVVSRLGQRASAHDAGLRARLGTDAATLLDRLLRDLAAR